LIAGDQPLSSEKRRDGSRQAISVRSGIIILAVVTVQLDRDSKETVMPSKDHVEKSCDSQLLPEGDPTSEWGLDHLGVYAQLQYRQIMDGEKSLTATYRRLGCALVHTKKIFKHGCWGQHLKLLGIDRTRDSKAMAIYRTFPKEEHVVGLRVDEAMIAESAGRLGNRLKNLARTLPQRRMPRCCESRSATSPAEQGRWSTAPHMPNRKTQCV
jgi:hypothetical protein